MIGTHGEAITVQRRTLGEPDVDGEQTETVTETMVEGCGVQPVMDMGQALFEQTVIVPRWKVIGPYGQYLSTLIDGNSRILWRDKAYKPTGPVQDYRTADRLGDHSEFYMLEEGR
ncbi:hypothetical protein [Bifidobacterium xylocopae]|uniref:Uncharacterized protein n=1 Tax=Bifidobacterium xylocopae TaxID=2493119 RepID=A0A366KEB5_9BIFI|nr:hypothetical protein [Bifidobacterium xylocopae]RBQ00066.1 hypothetical protein CRD59_00970 [Bifidobacterium xylocopae]